MQSTQNMQSMQRAHPAGLQLVTGLASLANHSCLQLCVLPHHLHSPSLHTQTLLNRQPLAYMHERDHMALAISVSVHIACVDQSKKQTSPMVCLMGRSPQACCLRSTQMMPDCGCMREGPPADRPLRTLQACTQGHAVAVTQAAHLAATLDASYLVAFD